MSGYPPIPRDPSGAPLPVVWDDGLQSWKVYEGLMPLETKLAAIESKLLALDSKFADGSAKVALSGTIKDIHSITRSGNLNAKTTETVVETTAEVVVQSLLFMSSVRSTDVYFTMQVQKANGTWVNIGRIISPILVGYNHYMNAFNNGIWASTLWTELEGPGENQRVIALNTSVERRFKGLKIVIVNNTVDNIDFAVALLYSEVI